LLATDPNNSFFGQPIKIFSTTFGGEETVESEA
jgi:hypothetical protein